MTTREALFLPTTREEMTERGWKEADVVVISGDAYVDHPSFGTALIARYLESLGLKVGIVAQPDWRSSTDFARLGKPRLFFGVTAGALDSMVSNFSSPGKRRARDSYAPGGRPGRRPDRATIVYVNRLRELFGSSVPIVIGGIEASLRRLAHYDFWDDAVRRSILVDSRADLLVYGMAEHALGEIASRLQAQVPLEGIPGTVRVSGQAPEDAVVLPSFEEISSERDAFNRAFALADAENNPILGKRLVQKHGDRWVIVEPPPRPLSEAQMDALYDLPFARRWHPVYEDEGGVPGLDEILFSITAHRGCLGSCSFCTLAAHQGRIIQSRSDESILREARLFTRDPRFKGIIHDVGGPSANFHDPACEGQAARGPCRGKACMHPSPCRHLRHSQTRFTSLLRQLRDLPGIRRVFVRSGVRYDMALLEENREFLRELVAHHVSGQLKVAPEHVDDRVLRLMGKPGAHVFEQFEKEFTQISQEAGKEQYLIPYLISGHPGADLLSAVHLAEFVKSRGRFFEQVQDFVPLPMTRSACQWYTGRDPITGESVHVARDPHERRMQRALIQYQNPRNWPLVREALRLAGREDLIGHAPGCLVPPEGGGRSRGGKLAGSRRIPGR